MTSFAADRSRRTTETDRWLAGLLGAEPGVALVAVGGYGRKELLPGSDLDVLLLHDGREGIAQIADRIWYPVWDSGAHLDHAVRTVPQARRVARSDLKVALGLLHARHVAGDPDLTTRLREGALEDWRANARTRLAELKALHEERTRLHGELAFLLEPDLKESRGGQRDVHAIQAIAAAWVAPAPGPEGAGRLRADHSTRGTCCTRSPGGRLDRLVLEEQDEVARALGLLDGDALLRQLAGAGRTVAYAVDHAFRRPTGRAAAAPSACGCAAASPSAARSPTAWSSRTARWCWRGPRPRRPTRCSCCGPPPRPPSRACRSRRAPWPGWPSARRCRSRGRTEARNALLALLGAGPNAIAVWEALDQEGLLTVLIPDWERVRNRPQRNPLHRFTVDRHLVECAANAAALARDVSRPDLLLLAALLHDIGKGWPGDHSVSGEVVARDVCKRVGLGEADAQLVAAAVRHHLLLPDVATRRDLDDPMTVQQVAATVRLADAARAAARAVPRPTGWPPARRRGTTGRPAWSRTWSAGSAPCWPAIPCPSPRRCARTSSRWSPTAARPRSSRGTRSPWSRWTGPACCGGPPGCSPRTGWRCAAPTRPRSATPRSPCSAWCPSTATRRTPRSSPRTCAGCSRAGSTWRTGWSAGPAPPARAAAPSPPPKVTLVDDASSSATVVEVRAHDEPGLLWRIGRALGDCGLNVQAARVETLGAEAVDVFYVTDSTGGLLTDPDLRKRTVTHGPVRAQPRLTGQNVRARAHARSASGSTPYPRGPVALRCV